METELAAAEALTLMPSSPAPKAGQGSYILQPTPNRHLASPFTSWSQSLTPLPGSSSLHGGSPAILNSALRNGGPLFQSAFGVSITPGNIASLNPTPGGKGVGASPMDLLRSIPLPTPVPPSSSHGRLLESPFVGLEASQDMMEKFANQQKKSGSSSARKLFSGEEDDETARDGFSDLHGEELLGAGADQPNLGGRRALTISQNKIHEQRQVNKEGKATKPKKKKKGSIKSLLDYGATRNYGSPLKMSSTSFLPKVTSSASASADSSGKSSKLSKRSEKPGRRSQQPQEEAVHGAHKSISTSAQSNSTSVYSTSPEDLDPAKAPPPPRNPCNCKKSKCLKLYCECFAARVYCDGCNCIECKNNPASEQDRAQAIKATLERNPAAFDNKIQTTKHMKGCHCKKSFCLKKYCECFLGGVHCGAMCKCANCKNFEGSPELAKRRGDAAAAAAAAAAASPTEAAQAAAIGASAVAAAAIEAQNAAKAAAAARARADSAAAQLATAVKAEQSRLRQTNAAMTERNFVQPIVSSAAMIDDDADATQDMGLGLEDEKLAQVKPMPDSLNSPDSNSAATEMSSSNPAMTAEDSFAATPQRSIPEQRHNKRPAATSNEREKTISNAPDLKKRKCVRNSASIACQEPFSADNFVDRLQPSNA